MNPSQKNVVADGRGGWVEGDHGPAAHPGDIRAADGTLIGRKEISDREFLEPILGPFAKTRRTILMHLNVEVPATDRRDVEELAVLVGGALEVGLSGVDGVSADLVMAEEL